MSETLFIPNGSSEQFILFGGSFSGKSMRGMEDQSRWGGFSDIPEGRYLVDRKNTPCCDLLIPISGRLTYVIDGKKGIVEPGQVIFIPWGVFRHYGSDTGIHYLWFHFRPEVFLGRKMPSFFCRKCLYYEEILLTAKLLLVEERLHPERSFNTANALQYYINREMFHFQEMPAQKRNLADVFESLQTKLDYPWTVEEMSRLCSLSSSRFSTLCRRLFSQSPLEMLRRMRMDYAADLLGASNETVMFIAGKCGYSDAVAFNKAFVRQYGCTPRKYRLIKQSATEEADGLRTR